MRAIILAAGRGSRMEAATRDQPKCATYIDGRMLIEWQLSALAKAGISETAIVVGYCKDWFERFDNRKFINPEWANTQIFASLKCANEWLREAPCVVSYSDIVYHPSLISALIASKGDVAITYDRAWRELWGLRFQDPLSDAETLRIKDGVVCEIGSRSNSFEKIEGQYMGLIKFTQAGWLGIEEFVVKQPAIDTNRIDMTALFASYIANGGKISGVPISGQWCEVDSQNDLGKYQEILTRPERWVHDWRWEARR